MGKIGLRLSQPGFIGRNRVADFVALLAEHRNCEWKRHAFRRIVLRRAGKKILVAFAP
jgi:hypothetical protein